ncbi:MAG TPA: type II secretion system F family protein [Bacillota bacterium]|nr:type II secretion system F family protein [Bacillota bacterium]
MVQRLVIINDGEGLSNQVLLAAATAEYRLQPAVLKRLALWMLEAEVPYFRWITRWLSGKSVRSSIIQLFGWERADTFMHIHLVQKLIFMGLATLFFALAGLTARAEPEFYLLGLVVLVLIPVQCDKSLEKQIIRRRQEILTDWPGFVNVLLLLVGAGLPFQTAFIRAAGSKADNGPLYREVQRVVSGLQQGRPLSAQLEELSRRCRVGEITRLVACVLPVLRQGGPHLTELLTLLAREAWEKRKELAVKQGEEAGARLVFPMVMVFVAIAILVLAPALITMDF